MSQRITRRAFGQAVLGSTALAALGGTLAAPSIARGAAPLHLRCSLDTAPSHVRNVSVADFLKNVEAESKGAITTELFQSGQLFSDLHVSKALLQGQVEMAVPGAWVLTGLVPDADMFQLPIFYGQDIELTHKVVDGKAGTKVADMIGQKLRSQVLGGWLDLGYQNWYFTTKDVKSVADLKGMKLRSPGGAGNSWRIRFLGGIPNTTAWPQVPLALSQGNFDGLISTDMSVETAKLWDAGVKHSLADHQFVGEYIPIISGTFWGKLSADQKKMMTGLWAAHIADYRKNMMAAQIAGRKTMEQNGVAFADATPEQRAATRQAMLKEQDAMAKEIKVSPEIVSLVMEEIGHAA
jgi:TRAP-type C4-dicarboxylate transport system substrate-binding protein